MIPYQRIVRLPMTKAMGCMGFSLVVDDDGATHHAHPARIGDSSGGCGREGNVIFAEANVHGNVEAGDDDAACATGHLVAEYREGHGGALLYVQDSRTEP